MRNQEKKSINSHSTPSKNVSIAPINTPIQHLYNLLYKKSEHAKLEWFNNSSAEPKSSPSKA